MTGPSRSAAGRCFAFFETHIEQGPILEAEKKTIGVVQGAQGQRWFEVTMVGQEAHAGPTPMKVRKDALVGAAHVVTAVNSIGHDNQPFACATVGLINSSPNSRNTIPGKVFFTIDLRHPEDDDAVQDGGRGEGGVRGERPRRTAWSSTSRRSGIRRR